MRMCVVYCPSIFLYSISVTICRHFLLGFFIFFFIFDFVVVCLCECVYNVQCTYRLKTVTCTFYFSLFYAHFQWMAQFSYNFTVVADGHTAHSTHSCIMQIIIMITIYYRYFAFTNRLHYMHNAQHMKNMNNAIASNMRTRLWLMRVNIPFIVHENTLTAIKRLLCTLVSTYIVHTYIEMSRSFSSYQTKGIDVNYIDCNA